MKNKKLLLVLLFVLIGLTSCQGGLPGVDFDPNGNGENIIVRHVVKFEENGGSEIEDMLINEGSKIVKPKNPVKDKYLFEGWFKDAELTMAWDFSVDTVKADTTLYAKWVKDPSKIEYEEVIYSVLMSDLETGKFAEETIKGRFTFNTEVEIRTRTKVWTNPENTEEKIEFTKSAKLGSGKSQIKVSVPGTGVLSFWIQNGSSGAEYQVVTVTDPSGVANDITFDGTVSSSPVVKIDVEVTEGDWVITRPSGTVDIYYMELACTVEKSEEVGFEIVANGKVEYIQGEELDYSGLQVQNVFENGKTGVVDLADLDVDSSSYQANVPGVYEIKVAYKDYPVQSYEVVVYEISAIRLGYYAIEKVSNTSNGNGVYYNHSLKQVYAIGEELDLAGITVIAQATHEGNMKEFIVSEGLSYSDLDTTSAGQKEITVTYEFSGNKLTCAYSVHVVDTEPSLVDGVYQVKVEQGYAGEIGAVVDGYNMFNTIKQALDYLASDAIDGATPKHLVIGEGTYNEKIEIEIPYLTITGAGVDKTLVEWDSLYGLTDESGYTHTTDSTQTVAVREAAKSLIIEDITLSNYWNSLERFDEGLGEKYPEHRALALLIQADQVIVRNAALLGYQDTVEFMTGRQYLENVLIKGATDFIFGTNNTTYFKNCTIHSISIGQTNGGYITAFKGNNKGNADYIQYGAIFDECIFTADADVLEYANTAIGRPWGPYAAVMVMNSELGSHISTTGSSGASRNERYVSMNAKPTDETVNYLEYNNTGAGAISEEVAGMRFATAEEAAAHRDFAVIFGKSNGKMVYLDAWDPTSSEVKVDERTYYYFDQSQSETGTSYTFDIEAGSLKGKTYQFGGLLINAENASAAWNQNANAFNMKAGAFITFEVTAGSEVLVTTYPNYNAYTINGVATSNDSTFVQYYEEATTVTIMSTGDLYLYNIIINPNGEAPEEAQLEEIKVEGLALNYTVGDELSFDELVVKAYYSNGAVYTLDSADYSIDSSAVNNGAAGSYDLVVAHKGLEVILTLTFEDPDADPAITSSIVLSFVNADSFAAIENNPRVELSGNFRANGSEYQISGTVKFMVKAGTVIIVNPYANPDYASFTIGAEGEEGLETLNSVATYVAKEDCTIVYTGLSNNYLVSIEIICPVANQTYAFGSKNSTEADYLIVDAALGNISIAGKVRDNGDSVQISQGSQINFVVPAFSTIKVTGHSTGYGIVSILVNGEPIDITYDSKAVYTFAVVEASTITIEAKNAGTEEAPNYSKSYIKLIEVSTQLPIDESINVTFGSNGNYDEQEVIDFSGIQIGDNGGNNSQVKNGSISFVVKAGATVTINGYSGYTDYTFSDGLGKVSVTDSLYVYEAEETVQITITPNSGNNYFYSFSIVYPVIFSEDTTINLLDCPDAYEKATGNWNGLNIDATNGKFKNNGSGWVQFNNGTSISFLVEGTPIISVVEYKDAGLVSVVVENGVATLTATGNTYISSLSIAFPIIFDKDTTINVLDCPESFEKSIGSWNGLNIDASNGKFKNNGSGWVQFNAGTIVSFYVVGNPSITVVEYNNAGLVAVVVENGVATLTATGNTYISSISIAFPVTYKAGDIIKCNESAIKVQGSVGEWAGLTIDATNSKWDGTRGDSWCQTNAALVITFAVSGDVEVVVNTYSADAAEVKVENGICTITLLKNDYISSIEIK